MESMNKFKFLTIMIICLFVFAVSAMYINTKDASDIKLKEHDEVYEQLQKQEAKKIINEGKDNYNDVSSAISNLNRRIDELSKKVETNNSSVSNSNSLNCRIYGSKTPRGIEELNPNAAIQDAQINNNEIVITCSLAR